LAGLYRHDGGDVAAEARDWALTAGANPRNRIVLAGYDTEHPELEAAGWTCHEWYRAGWLRGGMGNTDGTSQQERERLWASPHCLSPVAPVMALTLDLFGAGE
jgi:hypothetical protein